MEEIKVLELFGGIGACSKAFKKLKIPHMVVDYVEINHWSVKSYNAIHNTNFEPQDIIKWDKDIEIDFLMHGSPCTSFSLAGKQEGGDEGTNTKSSLMYETLRIVDKLRPKYVLWENVANVLSDKHKHNFYKYINVMKSFGYINSFDVLNAADYGIPQGRKRAFVLSILGDEKFTFPLKQKLTKTFYDYLDDLDIDERVILNENDRRKMREFGANYDYGGKRVRGNIYPTILANYDKGSGNSGKIPYKDTYRILTAKECWRLMGFDDEDYEKAAQVCPTKELYKQAGNSIVVNVLEAILTKLFLKGESKNRLYKQNNIIDYTVKALLQDKFVDENGDVTVEFWTPNCTFWLTIEKYQQLEGKISDGIYIKGAVNQSTVKLLETALIKLSEQKFKTDTIDLDFNEYMKIIAKSDRDGFKRSTKNDIYILKNVKIKFRDLLVGDYIETKILNASSEIRKNKIHVKFSEKIYKILKNQGTYIYMPVEILQANERKNPNYYLIAKKLITTLGNNNQVSLKIKELYDYCVTIPRIEVVAESGRQYAQRIRQPIDRGLNDARNILDIEYENADTVTFKDWLNSNIIIKSKEIDAQNVQKAG